MNANNIIYGKKLYKCIFMGWQDFIRLVKFFSLMGSVTVMVLISCRPTQHAVAT